MSELMSASRNIPTAWTFRWSCPTLYSGSPGLWVEAGPSGAYLAVWERAVAHHTDGKPGNNRQLCNL